MTQATKDFRIAKEIMQEVANEYSSLIRNLEQLMADIDNYLYYDEFMDMNTG